MTKFRALILACVGILVVVGNTGAQVAWIGANGDPDAASSALLDRRAKLRLRDATLAVALTRLSEASGAPVAFSPSLVAAESRRVDCDCGEITVRNALEHLLEGTLFGYRELRGEILVLQEAPAPAVIEPRYPMRPLRLASLLAAVPAASAHETRQGTVTGRVTEIGSERPLSAAQVQISGTDLGSLTDAEGRFEIEDVPAGDAEVTVRLLGYVAVSQTVNVPSGGTVTADFQLERDVLALDELVVIGYGEQRRSNITGAISTVRGDEITRVTSGGVQEALQGRITGVTITPTSGQPGGALDVNVRGVATFGSGNPLFVIDGVPVLSEGASRNFNPLASLDPGNIESIQVLKDASASAIYGARAANGVVIITTGRGASRPTQVRLTASRGISAVQELLPMMNTEQWIPYATEAYANAGRSIPVGFQEPLLTQNLQRNTDWQREAFSTATIENYSLGISGGSDNISYALSGGYLDQEGTLPNSGFKRYSARINTDFAIGEKLTIGESIELSRAIWTGTFNQASYTMRQLNQQAPTVPVYNPDALGGFDGPRLEYGPVGRQNSIGHLTLDVNERTANKLFGNAYAEYELLPGLTNRLNLGAETTFGDTFEFFPTFDMGDRVRDRAILNEGRTTENVYLIENTTTYRRLFNDVHDLSVLAGITRQDLWTTGVGVQLRNFPNDDLRTIAAGFEQQDITGDETGWALLSQIGRIDYSYADKYNLMFTIRRDGSSRFGRNNRYGVFPSVSGSWIVTAEPFAGDRDLLSHLALRASYGQVGNQDIGHFAQYATVAQGLDYVFGGQPHLVSGSTYLNLGNPDLKWEVTTQANVGLDVGLFEGRLSLEMDYYIKDTDDILLQLPVPTTSGIRRDNGPFVNAGSMRNRGFELGANFTGQLLGGEATYRLSGNFATNRNRVNALHDDLPIIGRLASGKQEALTITEVGLPIGSFYGYVMDGVFRDQEEVDGHATQPGSAPGDVRFRDVNGDGVIDASDMTVIGDPFPNFTYGLDLSATYKALDVAVLLHGKHGHDLYNLVWADLNEGEGDNNATTEMLRRWTPDSPDTDIPRAVTGNPGQNTRPSSRFVEDGSFLRIQNVRLGYTVDPGLASRVGLPGFRVYLSAQNLHTITGYRGYNPEIGLLTEGSRSSLTRGIDFAMYPIPRTFELGVQLDLN